MEGTHIETQAPLAGMSLTMDSYFDFMALPLELRRKIYGFASQRVTGTKIVLKTWLEHIDSSVDATQPAPSPWVPVVTVVPPALPELDTEEEGANEEDDEGEDYDEDEDEDEDEDDSDGDDDDDGESVEATDEMLDDQVMEDEETDDTPQSQNVSSTMIINDSYVGRFNKYRHVIPILRMSHCPPPPKLLQLSKQINAEVDDFCYNVLTLEILPFKGIAHTDFLEETLELLKTKPYSPLERIRKARAVFVWDSDYLQRHHDPESFETESLRNMALLRAGFAVDALAMAPLLRDLYIEFHDSSDAGEALRADIMEQFQEAFIVRKAGVNSRGEPINLQESVVDLGVAGAKPDKKSLVGMCRNEFRQIRRGRVRMF